MAYDGQALVSEGRWETRVKHLLGSWDEMLTQTACIGQRHAVLVHMLCLD